MKHRRTLLLAVLALGLLATVASAADATPAPADPLAKINSGDTAWLLLSAALVMLMTPGLAFFYGGLVRRKNVLSVLMQCMMLLCLISVQWVLFGYSLAFGPDFHHFIGNLDWIGLAGVTSVNGVVGLPSDYAPTVPHLAFMIFQMMFAVITPALILGAFAERMRFGPFCIFSLVWATIVYCPIAHWVWGAGGFLNDMHALDFAGGTVVHLNAGMAALAAALYLGKRKGFPDKISPPHSLPFAVLGAALLWFGWFGFNAGSALAVGGSLATTAFVATHVAAAMAGLTWAVMDWIFYKRPTVLGIITGAVAGLVAITPASGFVTPLGALAVGLTVGIICWLSVNFVKAKLGYDDSLDAFGVHGVGGAWGALATGLFATVLINPAGQNGLFHGNPGQLWIQFKAIACSGAYSFAASFLLLKLVDLVFKLRVTENEERIGLDLVEHREVGYTMID
jgi:Amt family ammonium transporter